jgi:cytochrome P450
MAALEIDPFSDETLADPYDYYGQLRAAGSVTYIPKHGVYAIGRFEDVRSSLTDFANFVSSRGVGMDDFLKQKSFRTPSLLIETDPPDHTVIRKVMGSVINPAAVRALRKDFVPDAEALADELIARGRFDGVTDVAERFPLTVFPRAVGLRAGGHDHLLAYGAIVFNSLGPRNHLFDEAMAAAGPVSKWIEDSCQRDVLEPDGFGAAVWGAADRGEITYDEAPILTRSFLSAGIDTTIYALGNVLYALATHPAQYRAIHEDPRLRKFAFDEALRWESPVQTFFRTTVTDVEIGGTVIPRDSKVLLSLASANRDPEKWGDDAAEFNVRRGAGGHLAFGMGAHQCVGQPIARLEAEVVIEALAKRAVRLELDGEPVPKLNNMLKGWASLPLRVVPA